MSAKLIHPFVNYVTKTSLTWEPRCDGSKRKGTRFYWLVIRLRLITDIIFEKDTRQARFLSNLLDIIIPEVSHCFQVLNSLNVVLNIEKPHYSTTLILERCM